MEYVRLYTALLTHPKAEGLSDRAWRCLTLCWCYAGLHETAGRVPPEARRFVRMTPAAERELIERGWLHRNGAGWVMHDWGDHQAEVDELAEQRRKARERKRAERRRKKEASDGMA